MRDERILFFLLLFFSGRILKNALKPRKKEQIDTLLYNTPFSWHLNSRNGRRNDREPVSVAANDGSETSEGWRDTINALSRGTKSEVKNSRS